jgi:predicted nucleotidyltransferase
MAHQKLKPGLSTKRPFLHRFAFHLDWGGNMNKRQTALEQICRQFDVAILYSFGSRAAEVRDWFEENRDHLPAGLSDADIGVKVLTGKKWSVREKVRLAGALEEVLGISRVDLVCLTEADPFVAAEIIRGERLFASDSHEADEYELYVLRRAGDLAPLERERMALVLGEPT